MEDTAEFSVSRRFFYKKDIADALRKKVPIEAQVQPERTVLRTSAANGPSRLCTNRIMKSIARRAELSPHSRQFAVDGRSHTLSVGKHVEEIH